MIKFPNSNKEYVQVKDCHRKTINGTSMLICPYCRFHENTKDRDKHNDCKTIIYENGLNSDGKLVVHGQCMCYSKEHGVRGD